MISGVVRTQGPNAECVAFFSNEVVHGDSRGHEIIHSCLRVQGIVFSLYIHSNEDINYG